MNPGSSGDSNGGRRVTFCDGGRPGASGDAGRPGSSGDAGRLGSSGDAGMLPRPMPYQLLPPALTETNALPRPCQFRPRHGMLPNRLVIAMPGDGILRDLSAKPVRIFGYRFQPGVGNRTLEGWNGRWVYSCVVSDRYDSDRLSAWQRIARAYIIQRQHVWRSTKF